MIYSYGLRRQRAKEEAVRLEEEAQWAALATGDPVVGNGTAAAPLERVVPEVDVDGALDVGAGPTGESSVLAPDVGARATGHSSPEAPESASSEPSLPCPHGDAPCFVVDAVARELEVDLRVHLALLDEHLPCPVCAVALERQAASLAGVRLGRRARDVWRRAAEPSAKEGALAVPKAATATVREATRRATVGLWNRGLVEDGRGEKGARVVWLTPFGAALRTRYAAELEAGARIRWDPRAQEAADEAKRPLPVLLQRVANSVKGREERVRSLTNLVIIAGDPAFAVAAFAAEASGCRALAEAAERAALRPTRGEPAEAMAARHRG